MKKIWITLFISLFEITSIYAQLQESVFYACDYCAGNTPTNFMLAKATQNGNKIVVTNFQYENNKWQKSEREVYSQVSDSVFMNENMVFNKNTVLWNASTPHKIVITKTENGLFYFREYNFNEVILREGYCKSYFPLIKHGEIKEYYLNGNLSTLAGYKNNRLLSSEKWMADGRESLKNVFTEVEKQPQFGEKAIGKFYNKLEINVYYPLNPTRESYVDGICKVEFIIRKDGSISDIQYVENSNFPEIDFQVYKFILQNKNDWQPAEICNRKVDYVMQIAYSFEDTRGNYHTNYW